MAQKNKTKAITVVGAGYVGLTTASIFAASGMKTYLVDVDNAKIKKIKSGKAPFFEKGLDKLIDDSLKTGNLIPTTTYESAIPNSQVVICCVGTPDNPDGSSNLNYVISALKQAATLAGDGVIFVQKSTVPAGTANLLIKTIEKIAPKLKFSYLSNPEFLREGSAIQDSLHPDRIVIGGSSKNACEIMADLYLGTAGNPLKSSIKKSTFIYTSLESSELIKVSANAFLSLKISFANSIAKLSDKVGADVVEVMDGVGKDRRIGRDFLNAGRGYGGGCFPKDVSGLISTASDRGVDMELMSAAARLNSSMPKYVVSKLQNRLETLKDKRIALLGLSFKAGTSDSRRSPSISIANILVGKGAVVSAYDPQAKIDEGELKVDVKRFKSLELAVKNSDVLVIATDWPEFIELDFAKIKRIMKGNVLLDCMNALDKIRAEKAGFEYVGVGR